MRDLLSECYVKMVCEHGSGQALPNKRFILITTVYERYGGQETKVKYVDAPDDTIALLAEFGKTFEEAVSEWEKTFDEKPTYESINTWWGNLDDISIEVYSLDKPAEATMNVPRDVNNEIYMDMTQQQF